MGHRELTIEDYRRFYAEEIQSVTNLGTPGLMEAFATVPREKFLGPGPWQTGAPERQLLASAALKERSYVTVADPRQLYHNILVVLDAAHDINNGQPSALGRWIDALDLRPGNCVYHVGCGVGYYTALMAEVVGENGSIIASELQPDLAARARENLSVYSYVSVHAADGTTFDPGECDAMLINAGVNYPSRIWVERLKDGGRLVLPFTISISPALGQGVMARIVRKGDKFSAEVLTMVGICSCSSLRDEASEALLKKALTTGALLKMKSLRLDTHDATDTCLVHKADVCLSSAEA